MGQSLRLHDASRTPVYVVSAMGIESSGLAVAPVRYSQALVAQGLAAEPRIVGPEDHVEHGAADQVGGFDDLFRALTTASRRPPAIVWIGLHTDEEQYLHQLETMCRFAARGTLNIVLPERTQRSDRDAYEQFERQALGKLGVAALIHLNQFEDESWSARLSLPSTVAPVPIPDDLFRIGADRSRMAQADGPDASLAFMGRLTKRKGADRLMHRWPGWRDSLRDRGINPSLRVYGREFGSELNLARQLRALVAHELGDVSWHPTFFDAAELQLLPERTVAVALSRQDFDGIAISEFLALGVPVVATPTTGHVALARESTAVVLAESMDEVVLRTGDLLSDDRVRQRLAVRGRDDMRRERSSQVVGRRLFGLIDSLLKAPTLGR